MSIIAQVVTILAYFIVGCIISVPYTYLANGTTDNFMLTAWIAPVGALVLFIVHTVERAMSWCKPYRARMLGGWFFWGLMTYFCLPIFLNGVSLLLNSMGFGTVGHYVFEFRYAAFLGVPVALVIFGLIAGGVENIREKFKGRAKPPSSQPPSNIGSGDRQLIVGKTKNHDVDSSAFQVAIV